LNGKLQGEDQRGKKFCTSWHFSSNYAMPYILL
jgi:hypothetical protein